jgi:MFS family permease
LASLFSRRSFIIVLVFYGLLGCVEWLILAWMPLFLQGHFHLRQGAAGISATGFLNASALVGGLVGGAWADRWARTNARGRIWVPAIGLLVAGPGIWITGQGTGFAFAMLGLTLFGLCVAFTESNMMPMLCLITDPRHRAMSFGSVNLANTMGGGLAIYAAGVLMDAHVNLGSILAATAGGLILCAMLLFFVRPAPLAQAVVVE